MPVAGQSDGFRDYRPGQNLIAGWGEYPLQTEPNVQTIHLGGSLAGEFVMLPSAFRIGNILAGRPEQIYRFVTLDVNR